LTFPNVESLVAQMHRDMAQVRTIMSQSPGTRLQFAGQRSA